ncbi:MAG: L-threonylcarbamoyladenylate synthase [Ilumatobacter sp.]|uniref:L-threonylcarbamoyladenylate synthase n=1 Tax=Ilumatobacter sp. TaxID=1967498 RepID=UPI00329850CE
MTRRLVRDDLAGAVDAIRRGGLVAMPTETVYGLAADATDPVAVARIFAAKGRPVDHPLIVHLADPEDLDHWAPDASAVAHRLATTCWPGPLTLIVPRCDLLPAEVAGGRDSVALRVPAHPMARELIRLAGVPLAAPSANRFGAVSPTTAEHVRRDLGDVVDVILDGGPCPVGVESTIIDTTVSPVQVLRAGAVTADQVAELLEATVDAPSGPARASGMLASHYAPRCQVRLVDTSDDAVAIAAGTARSRILDLTHDAARYARDLYSELRRADDDGVATLIAVLPDAHGLGHAIRDRLTKAAAPRP